MNKETELKKIKDEIVACKKCSLNETRIYPVVGQGSHEADIVLVGEAPGANEDKQARPFCGAAGKILEELLESISLKRDQVYICNILKCRPPSNRDPRPEETQACTPYLERQLEAISPKVVGAMGNHAVNFLMKHFGLEDKIQGISKIHGSSFEIELPSKKIKLVPLYHPAVAVYNANMKESLRGDFKALLKEKKRQEKP